jgi:hypothetical protein
MYDETYLFIDGNYLREIHQRLVGNFFKVTSEIDFDQLKSQARARRAFFYDCVDDMLRKGEGEASFKARRDEQEIYFSKIRSLPGFHLRLGKLTGNSGNRRQKGGGCPTGR